MVILVDINGNLSISVRPYTILQAQRWNVLNKDHGFAIGRKNIKNNLVEIQIEFM